MVVRAVRFTPLGIGLLAQNPGSFVGLCPSSSDPNLDTPLAAATVRVDELRAYLAQAGTVLDPATSGCNQPADRPADPPSTVPVGQPSGVNEATRSDENGRATLTVRPKRQGKINIRGSSGKVVKTLGAASPRRSGGGLTG